MNLITLEDLELIAIEPELRMLRLECERDQAELEHGQREAVHALRSRAEQLEQSEAIAKHWRSTMCDESTLGLPPIERECRNW